MKTSQEFSSGIRTNDLLLTSADVSTNLTTELAGGKWPIGILYCNRYLHIIPHDLECCQYAEGQSFVSVVTFYIPVMAFTELDK